MPDEDNGECRLDASYTSFCRRRCLALAGNPCFVPRSKFVMGHRRKQTNEDHKIIEDLDSVAFIYNRNLKVRLLGPLSGDIIYGN